MNKEEQLNFIEENYPLYTNHISNRRIRHDFFKNISTELQAYLLGFFASDGSIDEKRKTMRIHLSKKDDELVYLFKDSISPDARIFTIQPHDGIGRSGKKIHAGESFGVDITSAILTKDLVLLGFGYRKSYSDLSMNNISDNLKPHFIRGYFDGDGCITGWKNVEANKKDRIRYSFDICGKKSKLLNEFKLWFTNNNINLNLNYLKRDDMYRIKTSSKIEISKIFNLLYNNSNFYLTRKFDKFNYYVNTEVSQLIADHRNA